MYLPRLPLYFIRALKTFLFLDKWDIFLLVVSYNTTHAVDQLCVVSGSMTGSVKFVNVELVSFFFLGSLDFLQEGSRAHTQA